MANMIKVDSLTYCGKEGQDIFSQMIYDLPLPAGITKMDDVKGKQKVYTGDMGEVWQEYTCDFTPNGEVVLDEEFLEPERIKVNMEECYDKFDKIFLAEAKEISLNEGIPPTFSEWFFNRLKQRMAQQYQKIFWTADKTKGTGVYNIINGVETILKNSQKAEVIQGSALTISNIIATLESVVLKAMEKAAAGNIDTEDYGIVLNKADYDLLLVALGKDCSCNTTLSVFKNYAKDGDTVTVMGFKVYRAETTRGTIIVGPLRNMILGFDTEDSQIEYKLINMRETTGENKFRIIALSNIAAAVAWQGTFAIHYNAA